MRFKISKLDAKALGIDEGVLAVVDHLNRVIDEIVEVTNNLTFIDNFKGAQIRSITGRSGQEVLVSVQGKSALILESSEEIESQQVTTKTNGLVIKIVTVSGRDATIKLLIL